MGGAVGKEVVVEWGWVELGSECVGSVRLKEWTNLPL